LPVTTSVLTAFTTQIHSRLSRGQTAIYTYTISKEH
jgi:hypothetical protein